MSTTMKQLKQSETLTINRSQINLNPYNPKKHTDKEIKNQLANLKKVGFNGGIKWNKVTSNLIDGHRRIKAMDIYYKYDGTNETDYQVKVEAVDFDEKTEKEQLTYEALGNTRADYSLVAEYINDIDYTNLGLSDYDINELSHFVVDVNDYLPQVETYEDLISSQEEEPTYEEKKEQVKQMKQQVKEKAIEKQKNEEAFITLSFSTYEAKSAFCEIIGIDPDERFAKGETVLNMIE
uniref:ParB protein n=1 Tax=Siphoviridae sp. ctGkF12 TaxID=2826224 RepID=A0A8S5M844_9CAUD|nr:MAG TPA: ParB protein [Siphoviridae sp. ctGkF12]